MYSKILNPYFSITRCYLGDLSTVGGIERRNYIEYNGAMRCSACGVKSAKKVHFIKLKSTNHDPVTCALSGAVSCWNDFLSTELRLRAVSPLRRT